jgi:hypothetical protein
MDFWRLRCRLKHAPKAALFIAPRWLAAVNRSAAVVRSAGAQLDL